MGHSWELSLPQLAASAVAIVLLVSLATVVGLRRWGGYGVPPVVRQAEASNLNDRFWQRSQVIDYWIELIDTNDVTGPGAAMLERHQVRIVTPLEKRAELGARLSDAMQGLGETRENQGRLNESLGEFIFAKPGVEP